MLRTKLCELLQIDAPILLAPMGPEIAGLELAAAVSNAGGLGMISFGGYPPAALRDRIRRLRELTSQPFAVNVLLDGPHLPFPADALIQACIEERVPVLSLFWGDPTPYVEQAHKAGIKVCDQVGSVASAKRAREAGVDFIIAQGVGQAAISQEPFRPWCSRRVLWRQSHPRRSLLPAESPMLEDWQRRSLWGLTES